MRLTLRDLPRKRAARLIVLWATDPEHIRAEQEAIVLARPSLRMLRGKQLDVRITLLTAQEHTKLLAMPEQSAEKEGAEVSPDLTLAVREQATQHEKVGQTE
jgi:hypothetical protein